LLTVGAAGAVSPEFTVTADEAGETWVSGVDALSDMFSSYA